MKTVEKLSYTTFFFIAMSGKGDWGKVALGAFPIRP